MNSFSSALNGHVQYLAPYISRGNKIVQSTHHEKMFVINYPDGGFISITSSCENMLLLHPPDTNQEFKQHRHFNFSATQAYKPTKKSKEETWFKKKKPVFTTRLN